MKFISGGLALLLIALAGTPAAAQQRPLGTPDTVTIELEDVIERSGLSAALDSIAAASAPELEASLDQLAQTLAIVGRRIAGDPQLRASAIRAAQGLTDVAQIVLIEQSRAVQEALRAAAERLGEMSVQQDTTRPPR
jgi:hypothetical protein